MGKLTPVFQVTLNDPAAKFGHYNAPTTSYEIDSAKGGWQFDDGLHHDSDRGIVTLNPICIPTDSILADWTGTPASVSAPPPLYSAVVPFQEITCPKTGKKAILQPAQGSEVAWDAISTSDLPNFFWIDLLNHSPAATATFVPALNIEYPHNLAKRYKVTMESNGGASLSYTEDSGTTYKIVDRLKGLKSTGAAEWSRLLFRVVGKHVYVGIDDAKPMHHFNSDAQLLGLAPVKLFGTGCSTAFAWHTGYYAAEGNGYGGPVQRSNVMDTEPDIVIRGVKDEDQTMDGTVTDDIENSEFNYDFTLASPAGGNGLATRSPIMHRVHVSYPASDKVAAPNSIITLDHIKGITEHIWFDPNTLNIYSEYSIQVDNESGQYSWVTGLRSCEIDIGYSELGGTYRRFTGIIGYQMTWNSSQSDHSFTVRCCDRSAMLKGPCGIQVCNLPYMDGWSIYKAMRYLANYAGIGDEWLAFPLDDSDETNNPNDYYLLPYGDEFHPLVRFPGGTYVWDCMQQLQRYVGYLLYFDADGMLQFYPYVPSEPGAYKKSFNNIGTANMFGVPNLDEMFSVSRTRDMSEVRNDVTIIGIDPESWKPVVAHDRDDASISNPSAENYLGYRCSMVWADSMFCSKEYAEQALNQIFGVARLPSDTITLFGWMQPDLFPLDIISAYDPHSTGTARPCWITDITNTIVSEPGKNGLDIRPTCTIRAQWLTPWG